MFVEKLATLLSEVAVQTLPLVARVDQLDDALAVFALPVRHDPDVCGDSGVVEELLRESDDCFQHVVRDDPASDVAFPATGRTSEQRGPVENDADPSTPVLCWLHLRDHLLKEEQRSVLRARKPG